MFFLRFAMYYLQKFTAVELSDFVSSFCILASKMEDFGPNLIQIKTVLQTEGYQSSAPENKIENFVNQEDLKKFFDE